MSSKFERVKVLAVAVVRDMYSVTGYSCASGKWIGVRECSHSVREYSYPQSDKMSMTLSRQERLKNLYGHLRS